MATNMDYEAENGGRYEDTRYDRDRSASPRPLKRDDSYRNGRDRSASPGARVNSRGPPPADRREPDERDSGARNPGSNLFVTGIHPRLSETEVSHLFEKYGEVEGCSIMKDPHTQESRGFGFVKMVTPEQADAAKEGLQGENIEGRTLSIEKARRARPRTPTPGKYFGPPKREDDVRGPRRFDDRRGGYGGGYRGDRGGDRYGSRYDDRDRYSSRRDDYGSRGIDRYASGRDDRYSSRGDDRREGYSRDAGRSGGGYGDARESREPYGGRVHDDRRNDDSYSRR
ncbi:hypothetical protein MMC25_000043 [Agyrium rufum]|nr:hypothetical protein [Agyrium rufum]